MAMDHIVLLLNNLRKEFPTGSLLWGEIGCLFDKLITPALDETFCKS